AGDRHPVGGQPRPYGGAGPREVGGRKRVGSVHHRRRAAGPDDGPVDGMRGRDFALQGRGAQPGALPRDGQAGQYGDEHEQAEGNTGGGPHSGQPDPAGPHPVSHPASTRNWAAGSGRRRTDSTAAAAGPAAVMRARATAGPSGMITSAHGTGVVALAVRVIAGTIRRARPIPVSKPAAAAGRLSAHCSRHRWPAWAAFPTPSAANTALCVRRERRLAATLIENPITPSSTAARPMASMAWRGAFISGLPSRAASWLAWPVTDKPRPGGRRGTRSPAVRSHQRVTGKRISWWA